MHQDATRAFVQESLGALSRESFEASLDEWIKTTNDMLKPGEVLSQEQLKEAKARLLKNPLELFAEFARFQPLFSSHSLEELQQLADSVIEETRELDLGEYDANAEKRRWAEIERSWKKEARESRKKCGDEICAGIRERTNEIREKYKLPPLPNSEKPEKEEEEIIDIPPLMKRRTFPVTFLKGSDEAIALYNLRKEGQLTKEGITLYLKGFELFQKLRWFEPQLFLKEPKKPIQERLLFREEPKKSFESLFRNYLKDAPGICFGEAHSETETNRILIENMELLAKLGVKTLFLEGFTCDLAQPWLDSYFAQKHDRMPKPLREMFRSAAAIYKQSDSPFSRMAVIKAAKRAKIRVVGIETMRVRHASLVTKMDQTVSEKDWETLRIGTMNYDSLSIIQEVLKQDPQGKFVIVAGAAHITKTNNVPGFSSILGCPNIIAGGKDLEQCLDTGQLEDYDTLVFPLSMTHCPPTESIKQRTRQLSKHIERVDHAPHSHKQRRELQKLKHQFQTHCPKLELDPMDTRKLRPSGRG